MSKPTKVQRDIKIQTTFDSMTSASGAGVRSGIAISRIAEEHDLAPRTVRDIVYSPPKRLIIRQS